MGWAIVTILFICMPLIVLGVLAALLPHRRNPIIRDRPQPDSRLYSVGKDAKKWMK